MALGLWLALTSAWSMKGPGALHGMVLGAGIAGLGLLGALTAGRDCLSVRTLLLCGLGFTVLSTMEFMNQVGRDATTHCALAEARTRILHMEERLQAMRHDEMITNLFFRLNEMDDMLSMVQQGAAATAHHHSAQWKAAANDRDYLRVKAQALRRHAAAVGDALRAKAKEAGNSTSNNATAIQSGARIDQELWGIDRRVEAIDSVIRYLDSKEASGDLTYDEYEIILEALLEGSQGHTPHGTVAVLQQEKEGLGTVKAAFDRFTQGSYDHVVSPDSVTALTKAQTRKENSRRHFESRFMEIFQQHGSHHGPAFRASLAAALDALPEHCVRELAAEGRLRWMGWALLAAQLAGGYTALTAFVHVAKKDE